MNKKRDSEFFIETLAEISQPHMTVNAVIRQTARMKGLKRSVRNIAEEIASYVEQGYSLSGAFSLCQTACFSGDDISLIICAEETGNYGETFKFLSVMYKKKNDARSKLMLCAAYPVLLILLTAGAAFAIVHNAESLFPFAKNLLHDSDFIMSMRRGIVLAFVFMAVVFAANIFFAFNFIGYSPLYFVFSLLEFLTKSGIDVFHAMDSVITASMKNDKLCGALTRVKESMRAGSAMSDSFAREKIFENYLFYLETASANGTSGTFFLVAQQIEKKREIREIVFFKIVEPSMLIAAGIYMLLILRCTVIPLMMNYGGIL